MRNCNWKERLQSAIVFAVAGLMTGCGSPDAVLDSSGVAEPVTEAPVRPPAKRASTRVQEQADQPQQPKAPEVVEPTPSSLFHERFVEVVKRFYTTADDGCFTDLEELFEEARISGWHHQGRAEPIVSYLYEVIADLEDPSDERYEQRIAKFRRWHEAYPDSCIPLIGSASTYVNWAWHARGSGFALTVDEDAWRPFRLRIVEARDLLDKAESISSVDAHLYVARIWVAKADGTERSQVDGWFDAGRKLDRHCLPLYRAMTEYLLPRWHGEPGDIERLAQRMQTEVDGKAGLTIYAAIANQQAQYEPYAILHGQYDRSLLHDAAKVIADEWPQSQSMNEFAALIAWMEQDLALAKKTNAVLQEEYAACWWRFGTMQSSFKKLCSLDRPQARGDKLLLDFSPVEGVRFTTSGKQLVTFGWGATSLRIWDLESDKLAAAVPIYFEAAESFDKHPSKDEFVASGRASGASSAVIVDFETLQKPRLLYDPGVGRMYTVRYSPDGNTILSGSDRSVVIWDAAKGNVTDRFEYTLEPTLSFAPDGKRVFQKYGEFYDPATKKWTTPWTAPSQKGYRYSYAAGFIDDDTLIGAAVDTTSKKPKMLLLACNLAKDKHEILFEGPPMAFTTLRLSPSKKLLAGCTSLVGNRPESSLVVYDLASRKQIAEFGPLGYTSDLDFSPDQDQIAVACADGGVRVFSLKNTNRGDVQ